MRKRETFIAGCLLLAAEITVFVLLAVADPSLAPRILSMVTANHIGGRLAFIAVGLENEFPSYILIPIIIFYNTTYLLLAYSIFVFFSERVKKLKMIRNYLRSFQNQALARKRLLRRWNWFSISLFVWIPLPWTGAAIGSYIAYLEGYTTRTTLLTVIPAMWVGIVSWTLWFDELYEFIHRFGESRTIFLTAFLVIIPILYYIVDGIRKRRKAKLRRRA
ncbi:MAG: small multi-drug export protein [Candidatus Aminicenantes bacterium]